MQKYVNKKLQYIHPTVLAITYRGGWASNPIMYTNDWHILKGIY